MAHLLLRILEILLGKVCEIKWFASRLLIFDDMHSDLNYVLRLSIVIVRYSSQYNESHGAVFNTVGSRAPSFVTLKNAKAA